MMEALQMLKFFLRKERFSFTAGWKVLEKQMVEDNVEEDLLKKVLENCDDRLWDKIMKTLEDEADEA